MDIKGDSMKASVIIPAYNVEDYIERCIMSVINQSEEDIEIIVVNDGSEDCSLKKIRNLQKLDTRIKVIDKKNEGVMKARYDGLKLATGDYILFLDGDDWIDKSAIESLCLSAEKNSSDILIYNIYWAYDIKNYYPVKDASVLWYMSQVEREKLCGWMSNISKEVALRNALLAKRRLIKGYRTVCVCTIT